MKKTFNENKQEIEQSTSLQEIQSKFSNTSEKSWKTEIISQVSGHFINSNQITAVEEKEMSIDAKSNFISECIEKKNDHLSNLFGNSMTKMVSLKEEESSVDLLNSKLPFLKNDHPSLFVHDNFFRKQASQNSSGICKKMSSNSKVQASQHIQSFTAQSFSGSQFVMKSSNGNMSSVTHELKNAHFSTKMSASQELSMQNTKEVLIGTDTNLSKIIIDSNKHISRHSFESMQSLNIQKFNTERLTQLYEFNYDNSSESDDEDEEDDDMIHESFILPKKQIDHSSLNSENSTLSDSNDTLLAIQYDVKKEKNQLILHKIASELLTTERTYVEILYLLDQKFAFRVDQENRVHHMFPQETVSQMFTNLKSLYKLHHDFLLPQLEDRMSNWENEHRIGDIMKNFAPFLKMYTEYVRNYDNSMKLINLWYQKHPRFTQIMDELHGLKESKFLTLQHHMLTPVQRIPRYQLLLKDYLKKLPEDSPDKLDTEKALELVSVAARHSNETIKKIDKFKKLLEIQEMIGGVIDLVSPSRELLKEGKIVKISARSGDHQDRYLFLFSDLVILCSHRLIPNKVVTGHFFRVRARFKVEDLLIEEGDNLETANTFYIRTANRVIELYTPTRAGKSEWILILTSAINDLLQKKSSLKVGKQEAKTQDIFEVGTKAPTFMKLDSITHCMSCDGSFSTFTFRRKHHCRACGIVACNKCLSNKVQLPYEGDKQGRVCNNCYDILVTDLKDGRPRSISSPVRQKGILDVNPNDPSVISGYLHLKARSRFWVRRWFALHDDFVLYSFNSHLDEMALTSMPVPGYTIGMPEKGESVDGRENVFKLFHKNKVYFFQAPSHEELERWIMAMEKASKAETIS